MVGRFNRGPLPSIPLSFGNPACGAGNREQSNLFKRSQEQLNIQKRLILHVMTYFAREKEGMEKGTPKSIC